MSLALSAESLIVGRGMGTPSSEAQGRPSNYVMCIQSTLSSTAHRTRSHELTHRISRRLYSSSTSVRIDSSTTHHWSIQIVLQSPLATPPLIVPRTSFLQVPLIHRLILQGQRQRVVAVYAPLPPRAHAGKHGAAPLRSICLGIAATHPLNPPVSSVDT